MAQEEESKAVSDDIQKSISRLTLEHCRFEYTDVCSTWRDVELKSQGMVAIAGIFLGGVLAITGHLDPLPHFAVCLLLLAVLALVGSVLCSLGALWVAEVEVLEDSSDVLRDAEGVLSSASDDEAKRRIREFVRRRAENLRTANTDIHEASDKKAKWLKRSQFCLGTAIVISSVLIIMKITIEGW